MGVTPIERIDLSKEISDWKSAIYGRDVRNANTSALEKIQKIVNGTVVNVNDAADQIDEIKQLADTSSKAAAESAAAAKSSAANAKSSETNAKTSETNAASSASKAKTSETNAKTSETKAKTSETNAASSESKAKTSETNAKTSETNAKTSETNAAKSATSAKDALDKLIAITKVDVMTEETAGIGKPDGKTISVDVSGTLRVIHGTIEIALPVSGWVDGTTDYNTPFVQTVSNANILATDDPILTSLLPSKSAIDIQKAYNKAFGIVSSGWGITSDGTVIFGVYKKPATDITVGLRNIGYLNS